MELPRFPPDYAPGGNRILIAGYRPAQDCIVLSNVVTPTRKSLEFKHASQ